jgi:hypothetical protein
MKPIPDKAEVALEYPDKLYLGSFERSSGFDAHLDEIGVALTLHQGGDPAERKSVRMHIHHALFAEILTELTNSAAKGFIDQAHAEVLAQAAAGLAATLQAIAEQKAGSKGEEMTATEEVTLLHILE